MMDNQGFIRIEIYRVDSFFLNQFSLNSWGLVAVC